MKKKEQQKEKVEVLGQFEQLVLTAAYLLGEEGYTVNITDKVNEISPKRVMFGAVYVTLDRMEGRGLLTSWFSEARPERGGKPRRYFKVTPAGERALATVKDTARFLLDSLRGLKGNET
jgi:DNA-binding PadR family transcriptional regulator